MSLRDTFLDVPFLKRLWSLLPSKCYFRGRGCPDMYLRWTEHELIFLSGPRNGQTVPICEDCYHRMRQTAFKHGHTVRHHGDDLVEYIPASHSEGSE